VKYITLKYEPMKKLIAKITHSALILPCLLAASLSLSSSLGIAKDAEKADSVEPKIASITNPNASYSVHIGDILSRKIVLEVPAPYQIVSGAFPKKGTKEKGIELVEVSVETDQQKSKTIYEVHLSYQAFINTNSPTVMQLPVEKFTITGGKKATVIDLPAWGFWFSPLVTGNIEVAEKNLQYDYKPPLLDINAHQTRLVGFLSLLSLSLLALLYANADANWLPFMGGAFAKAHRQLKRLAKTSPAKTPADEKQALVYIHQAFNKHYRANIFARDIDRFLTTHPSFRKMKTDIEQFFNASNQSLYSIDTRDSKKVIADLVILSKQLRDCERGV
jgi:mxaA protein